MTIIGVISDTHGLLRPEALAALEGVDAIIHAGDVGKPEILTQLESIAPVHVVRGNIDRGPWTEQLPETAAVEAGGQLIYVLHDLQALDIDPLAAGFRVVVTGHSHKPHCEEKNGVLFLNPGSAGPRRFSLPICLAKLRLDGNTIAVEYVNLEPGD
jgi:putative phosphoesterase